jgi:hypothetical protein
MSNLVSRSDEQGAFVAGADRYLTKGVPVAKLLHSLQRDPIGQATSTLRA